MSGLERDVASDGGPRAHDQKSKCALSQSQDPPSVLPLPLTLPLVHRLVSRLFVFCVRRSFFCMYPGAVLTIALHRIASCRIVSYLLYCM